MDTGHLQRSWNRTEAHLQRARGSLTDPDDESLAWYLEFVEHNELALAFDAMVDVAEKQRAPKDVWESLAAAAAEMGIGPDHPDWGRTLQKVRHHLAAGREWFQLRDLVNQWDPIGIYDVETDFPPDEYECLEGPLMSRLRAGESSEQIGEFLHNQLRDHFGLNPTSSRPHEFAERLTRWFAHDATGPVETA